MSGTPRSRFLGRFGARAWIVAALLFSTPLTYAGETAPLASPSPTVVAGVEAYNRGDIATAYRLLSSEADHGDSDAEVNLGYLYARGQGVPMNQQEAFRLYGLSAAQGNGEGM